MRRYIFFLIIIVQLVLLVHKGVAAESVRELFVFDEPGFPLCGASSRWQEQADWFEYHELNLFDGKVCTAWIHDDKDYSSGEEIWFAVEPGLIELLIINGYAHNNQVFSRFSRVKKLDLQLWVGINEPGSATENGLIFTAQPASLPWEVELLDIPEWQVIEVDLDWETAMKAMETAIDAAQIVERCAYFLTLTIKDTYRGSHYSPAGITSITWRLNPEFAGPGGLGPVWLEGTWENEKGSEWEQLKLEWFPFYQGWTAYVDGQVYDLGVWYIGNGHLILVSNSKVSYYDFFGWPIKENRLLLIGEDGQFQIWKRQ